MLELGSGEEKTALVKVCKNDGVCLLNEEALPFFACRHITLSVYELNEGEVVFSAHAGVIVTECGSKVNDTRTVAHCNVAVASNVPAFFIGVNEAVEGLVFHALERFTLHCFENFICAFAENSVCERCCEVVCPAVLRFNLAVFLCGVYAERNVGGKCPRCCRPGEERCFFFLGVNEARDGGAFFNGFVALRYFLCGKRCSATGAVPNRFEAFVKELLVPDFFKCPPL